MLESQFKTKVKKFLLDKGFYNFYVVSSNRRGIPDIVCCVEGKFIGLEIKLNKGVVSDNQKLEGAKIQAAGGSYHIITPSNFDIFKANFPNII